MSYVCISSICFGCTTDAVREFDFAAGQRRLATAVGGNPQRGTMKKQDVNGLNSTDRTASGRDVMLAAPSHVDTIFAFAA